MYPCPSQQNYITSQTQTDSLSFHKKHRQAVSQADRQTETNSQTLRPTVGQTVTWTPSHTDSQYLCLPQQLYGEMQPVRTAGLQLQSDEGQGQHGSLKLQQHTGDTPHQGTLFY